jgi:hypothetical protein
MPPPRPPFFWGVVVVALALVGAYLTVAAILVRYGGLTAEIGWGASRIGNEWGVTRIDAGGPADGRLQLGDVVLAVNGNPHAATLGPFYDVTAYDVGLRFVRLDPEASPYLVRVSRAGTPLDVALHPLIRYDPRNLATTLSLLATSLSFFIVGTFVGLSRPRDDLPRLLALASLPSAAMLLAIALQPSYPFLNAHETLLRLLLANVYPFHYLLAYGFFFRVAAGKRRPPLWRNLEIALWVGGIASAVMRTAASLIEIPEHPGTIDLAARHANAYLTFAAINVGWQRLFNPILTFALVAVLAANYRSSSDATDRRRLKWIVYGTVFGLGPLFIETLLRTLLAAVGLGYLSNTATYQFFYRMSTTSPILVPVTFGYAIARHRLLGVDVVVRRGLQYLFARNVLRLALSLPILGLVYTFASNTDKTIAEVLLQRSGYFYGFVLLAGVLSVNYRMQVTDWLDRRFFREVYNQEKILLALVESLKSCESIPEISRLACERIQIALHPTVIHLYYRNPEQRDFTLGHSSSGAPGISIPDDFAAIGLMQSRSRVLELSTVIGQSPLPASEEQWFRTLGVTMLIAMKGAEDRLCGLLLLGDKKSEEAYSPNDRDLLQAIASQAAIVCENLWLKEGMRREQQIRRDVLARVDTRGINLLKECPACGRCFDRSEETCPTDRVQLQFTVPVERIVDGRYRLDQRLGHGGMGVVYQAVDERMRRSVAVKILHGALFGAQDAIRRFEREAQTAGRLTHRHVVGMYDYGVIGSDGAYLVMELLRGGTWRHELNRRGSLEAAIVADWLDQVLDGLDAAHGIGLVHRDLKPENVMICPTTAGSSVVKILDFGLAKSHLAHSDAETAVGSLTAPGMVLGTYTYMSPEQLSGSRVDARADLFAIGVIAVESLTGERPFRGKTLTDLMRALLHDSFHLSGDAPEIRRLDVCLQRALAKNPADRYPSAAAMRGELIPVIAATAGVGDGR